MVAAISKTTQRNLIIFGTVSSQQNFEFEVIVPVNMLIVLF
jgi:hypothetical protein